MTASPGIAHRAARQERHLDLARDAQLFLEPALLVRLLQQLLDVGGHLVERLGELAELIAAAQLDAMGEVALRTRWVPTNSA